MSIQDLIVESQLVDKGTYTIDQVPDWEPGFTKAWSAFVVNKLGPKSYVKVTGLSTRAITNVRCALGTLRQSRTYPERREWRFATRITEPGTLLIARIR